MALLGLSQVQGAQAVSTGEIRGRTRDVANRERFLVRVRWIRGLGTGEDNASSTA